MGHREESMPTFVCASERKTWGRHMRGSIGSSPVVRRCFRCTFRGDAECAVTVISYVRVACASVVMKALSGLPRSGIAKSFESGLGISGKVRNQGNFHAQRLD